MELWKRNLWAMWSAQAAGMMSINFVITFIPLYVQGELGIRDLKAVSFWSGILVGSAALFAAFSGPVWGNLADRRGRKVMVVRVLLSSFIIVSSMSLAGDVYQFLALRSLQGAFGGLSAAGIALVASIAPPEKIGYVLGVFQTAGIAGAVLGPMIGGILADTVGYRLTFIIMGLVSLLAAGGVTFFVEEEFVPAPARAGQGVWRGIREAVNSERLLAMIVALFLVQFGTMVISPILPLFIKDLSQTQARVASTSGIVVAMGGLASAVSAVLAGKLSERVSSTRILIFSATIGGVLYLLQGAAQSVLQLMFLRVASGLFIGGMVPTANAIIGRIVPPEKRGVMYGVATSASLMGNVLGPLAGGAIAALTNMRWVFVLTAALHLGAAFWVYKRVAGSERMASLAGR